MRVARLAIVAHSGARSGIPALRRLNSVKTLTFVSRDRRTLYNGNKERVSRTLVKTSTGGDEVGDSQRPGGVKMQFPLDEFMGALD